ncbi:MAG TPA: hypothetical protein VFY03_03125, partial [Woeseiaceae bacterium]|nr:hypothetical protein [Woeseiaceae bacterium]
PDQGGAPDNDPDVSEETAAGPAGAAGTAAADGEDDTPGGQVIPGAPDAAEVEPAGGADEAPAAAAGDASTDVVPGTDDESYLDIDEEDFRPSEEIPTDQSIPFPTDI